MKPFQQRNPVIIGLLGFIIIGAMVLAAFRADRLPLIGGGDVYYANFSELGGLKANQEVRVAGVSVGKVKDISLEGNHVHIKFFIDKGTKFGTESGAAIKVKTLLGAEYLAIKPKGSGQLAKGSTIPVSRTIPPYNAVEAFSDLSEVTDKIDVPQLADALNTLSDITEKTPKEFRGALKGVSDLSRNLAARDQQINTLLKNLKKVSGVLSSKNAELEKLFKDSDVLFRAISARRDAIHQLLVSTQQLSSQLRGLVKDTKADLKPALKQLDTVTTLLKQQNANLDEALRVFGPFARLFANALGSGPWFDTYLDPIPVGPDALGLVKQLPDVLCGLVDLKNSEACSS